MTDLDQLKANLAELTAWRRANFKEKAGTLEFEKKTKLHRLLTDLVARNGGTPEERATFMRMANEI